MKTKIQTVCHSLNGTVGAGLVVLLAATMNAHAQYNYTTLNVPGADQTLANGISGVNVVGTYAGTYNSVYEPDYGYEYNGSTYTTLPLVGGQYVFQPTGISGNNIVGYYAGSGGYDSVVYNGSSYTPFNVPGATSVEAFGISGSEIVGLYNNGSGSQGFFYNGSTYTTLNFPGGYEQDDSANGVYGDNVVGDYYNGSTFLGFLYNGGTYTTLSAPGSTATEAFGISGNNIVGLYVDSSGKYHGFLYNDISDTYTTLDDPVASTGGSIFNGGTSAYGIDGNNIVGSYTDSSDNEHGFLAIPVPEPSVFVLLAVGATALLACRRRHLAE